MKKNSIINTILLIVLLLSISQLLIAISNKYILTQNFFDRNEQPLSGIPEMESIALRNIQHVIYLYAAVYLIVKLVVIALVIFTGLHYFGINASFHAVLRIVTQAEFIFHIPAMVKIWWFYHYVPASTLAQWEDFYFLSAASLTEYIKPVYLYPLQTFNAFEIAYWFILAARIKRITLANFDKSLQIVVYSYVAALFLWIILVIFFTMLLSPQAY